MKDKERDVLMSRICEIQLYLTTKIIEGRNTNYRPSTSDGDQPLRDEIVELRKKLGIIGPKSKET